MTMVAVSPPQIRLVSGSYKAGRPITQLIVYGWTSGAAGDLTELDRYPVGADIQGDVIRAFQRPPPLRNTAGMKQRDVTLIYA